jgi:acetyl-CoA carboxylase carboxyl transferase subunit alpha
MPEQAQRMLERDRSDRGSDAPARVPATPAEPLFPAPVDDAAAEALRSDVWSRVRAARIVRRPHTLELVRAMATDVVEIHGDRLFGDDPAIVAGFARIRNRRFVFVGHQKGTETEENVRRNFGMAHPEGYRKAMRAFSLAERFHLPVVTFVDTPGAYPGAASEERSVAEAIARSIMVMSSLRTPIVVCITGEGGSGGALAIAVGDVVLALENAIYSVISPEGCASIVWRDAGAAQQAAVALRLTADDQARLGVVDEVVPEPPEGAQEDPAATAATLAARITWHLDRLADLPVDELIERRFDRYRKFGSFATVDAEVAPPRRQQDLVGRLRGLVEDGLEAAGAGIEAVRATLGGPEQPPGKSGERDAPDAPSREER